MEQQVRQRKQTNLSELFEAQRRRKSDIQTDLLRIVDGEGTLKNRKLLQNPGPWNESARGSLPYEPFEKGVLMLRDAARTARIKGNSSEQDQTRANIRAFLATIERFALEELPENIDADPIPLMLLETKAQNSGDEAQDLAKIAPTRENLLQVARATDAQVRVGTKLRDACYRAADRGLSLIRNTPARASF
jgi:hypothetical protein